MEETLPDPDATPEKTKTKVVCPNCNKKIAQKAVFCSKCGQKQTTGKVSMRDFLWKLWMTTFHLDSRVLRTFAGILVPGKLTLAYFEGKQKKYFHPIQFFFIALFFLALTISYAAKSKNNMFQFFNFFDGKDPLTVKAQVDMRDSLMRYRDSLPEQWRSPAVREPIDSLIQLVHTRIAPPKSDSFSMNITGHSNSIAYQDVLHMEPDSLIRFYQINGWIDRIMVKQVLRSGLHADELGRFWGGTLSWSALVLIAVMAGWLKLLYWRRKRYFVEHFVLMLHLQTALMVVVMICIWLRKGLDFPKYIALLALFWLTVGYFIAFKRYYQQGYLKTFLKWTIFHFLYLLSLLLVLMGSMAAAVLLF